MISNEDQQVLKNLMKSNPDFKSAFEKQTEENRLILSRFTHELRNPLTLVKSTIQLIGNQHPEVNQFKYWPQLISDIDSTVELLNQLSVYNHCDEIQSAPTDLILLIDDTVESMKPFASSRNLEIEFTYEDKPKFHRFSCDKVKMKEVITNLLKNAVEDAFENTRILVHLDDMIESKTNGHYIYISITDSGNPIPTENLSKIFDPFVTFKANGTGLGLAISQKIACMHKGNLSVSQTDTAITFTIQLPIDVIASKPLYNVL